MSTSPTCNTARLALSLVLLAGCTGSNAKSSANDTRDMERWCKDCSIQDRTDAAVDAGVCAKQPRPVPQLTFEQVELPDMPEQATTFAFAPDSDELFVARKSGVVSRYRLDKDGYEKLGEFSLPEVWSENDCGLLSIAFDPDFATNHFMYGAGCIAMTANRIWRATIDESDDDATSASAVEILTVTEPKAPRPFHNSGSLEFDADGHLWALFGDKVRSDNGQDLSDDLGGVLRIDPNRDPDGSGSQPAAGNPFEFSDDASHNVYAYGLRYPFRGTFDRKGRFWVGDVGAEKFEEVDVITRPGMNFGWDEQEGPCKGSRCADFVEPVVSWSHDPDNDYAADDPDIAPTESTSVSVGVMYEDRGNDRYAGLMTDRLLFGDFCPGWVRVLEVDDDLAVRVDAFAGHLETAVQWRQGPDGYVYALTFGTCGSVVKKPPESKLFRALLNSPCAD
jgi:glucose/arabinose dehydrogenase